MPPRPALLAVAATAVSLFFSNSVNLSLSVFLSLPLSYVLSLYLSMIISLSLSFYLTPRPSDSHIPSHIISHSKPVSISQMLLSITVSLSLSVWPNYRHVSFHIYCSMALLKMAHSRPLLLYSPLFNPVANSKQCSISIMPTTGFEPRISGVWVATALPTEPQPLPKLPRTFNLAVIHYTKKCRRKTIELQNK